MVYFLSANKKTVVTVWILCSKHREAEWYKQISGLELIAVYQYDEELMTTTQWVYKYFCSIWSIYFC